MPAPVDHALDPVVGSLEGSLDGAVGEIADESREPERLGAATRLVAEADALDRTADTDVRAFQSKPSSPTSGTNLQGTERMIAGPSGLRTTSKRSCERRRPTGIAILPPGSSCSYSVSGTSGAAAATAIALNGARSGTPSVPSPTRTSTFS